MVLNQFLFLAAALFCIGVYGVNNDLFQVGLTLVIGIFGYILLLLGFHLGFSQLFKDYVAKSFIHSRQRQRPRK